jgi:hypothetical protein
LVGEPVTGAPRRSRLDLPAGAWAIIGLLLWGGIWWLAARMFSSSPPTAGFDLELLLRAGRDIAAGRSPYDASIVAGGAPEAVSLFYSYPPLIGQALAPFAAVPSGVMFLAWSAGAIAGVALVAEALRRRLRIALAGPAVVITTLAVVPLVLPFAVAILFGNLDALFPLAYGLALLAAVSPRPGDRALGGGAIALASLAKLYPAGLGIWFLVRAVRERGHRGAGAVVAAAIATGLAAVGLSLLAGGVGPWLDFSRVAAAASGAHLVDPRNAGPAAQIALALGGGDVLARSLHVPVVAGAVALTGWAAWTQRDPVLALSIAAVASLVILPVTWFHYPAALIPFGVAAVLRAAGTPAEGATSGLLAAAITLAALAIVWAPLLWPAAAVLIAAVHRSQGVSPAAGTFG